MTRPPRIGNAGLSAAGDVAHLIHFGIHGHQHLTSTGKERKSDSWTNQNP